MITRGTLIGEILDELAHIVEKVEIRSGCQIYDLPAFAENFCRDILEHVLASRFKNLNSERSNNPGIDLGATNNKYAIQVTATSTSEKINHTLQAITDAQRKKYKRFIVLILGRKQATYGAVDSALASKNNNFDTRNDIWDLRDIAKMAFDLEIEKLHLLHKEIRNQTLKLQVDLQIRPKGGEFKTNGYGLWEAIPAPKLGSGNKFIKYIEDVHGELREKDKILIKEEIKLLASRLSRLPRLTREFFVSLIERRAPGGTKRFSASYGWESLLLSSIERLYNGPDLQGELGLLEHEGFIDIQYQTREDYEDGPSAVGFKFSFKSDDLNGSLIEYLEKHGTSMRTAISDIDLSAF